MSQITCKNQGFTLAEVLITIAIIGVVAAIIMPSFMQDMAERINSHRQANIAQKITKSVELMTVNGDHQGINNTEEFVNKLSKYLKIAKICKSNELEKCWPTKKIKTAKEEEYNISDAKTSKDLHTRGTETDNVGLILEDGATIIMTFNPDAKTPSAEGGFKQYKKALPIGNGKTEEFAYSSNATDAIDFVMDVNGKTGPNQETDLKGNYYDIRSFKNAAFSQSACPGGIIYEKTCIIDLGYVDPIDCTKSENAGYCNGSTFYIVDYWAGANKACQEMGLNLPTNVQYRSFQSKFPYANYTFIMRGNDSSTYRAGVNSYGSYGSTVKRNTQLSVVCISDND